MQHLNEVVFTALVGFSCTQVRAIGSNNHQTVIQGYSPSPTRCCAAHETGVLVKMAPSSRQCSSTFLALYLDFFAKNQTSVVRQATYSPDMAPCDFWLFPKHKRSLKGKRMQTREDIMTATTAELNTIPKEAFLEGFQQWRHR